MFTQQWVKPAHAPMETPVAAKSLQASRHAEPSPDQITLDLAIPVHQRWNDILCAAVAAHETLDVATLKRDDCCDLGRWLHSGASARYGSRPAFVGLLKRHREFHDVVGIVAAAINGGEYLDAKSMLVAHSQFAYASIDVCVAIMKLRFAVGD